MKGFCGINYGTATVSQRIALLLTLDPAGLNCFDKKKALSLKKDDMQWADNDLQKQDLFVFMRKRCKTNTELQAVYDALRCRKKYKWYVHSLMWKTQSPNMLDYRSREMLMFFLYSRYSRNSSRNDWLNISSKTTFWSVCFVFSIQTGRDKTTKV